MKDCETCDLIVQRTQTVGLQQAISFCLWVAKKNCISLREFFDCFCWNQEVRAKCQRTTASDGLASYSTKSMNFLIFWPLRPKRAIIVFYLFSHLYTAPQKRANRISKKQFEISNIRKKRTEEIKKWKLRLDLRWIEKQ